MVSFDAIRIAIARHRPTTGALSRLIGMPFRALRLVLRHLELIGEIRRSAGRWRLASLPRWM